LGQKQTLIGDLYLVAIVSSILAMLTFCSLPQKQGMAW